MRIRVKTQSYNFYGIFVEIFNNIKHQFMAHTAVRGTRVIQTNDISVSQNTAI